MSVSASVYRCKDSHGITWLHTVLGGERSYWKSMVSLRLNHMKTESSAKRAHTESFLLFSARFYWLHFNLIQWRGLSSAHTSPTMSRSPSFSLTLYCSLPPNQLLTSLAPFSLAHRRRTCTSTHAGTTEQLWLLIMRELSHQISVCAAVWPGGRQNRTEAMASDWRPRDRKEGWALEANSFRKVEDLWRRPSCSLQGPNGQERTFQHFLHCVFQINIYFIWIFGF